jgi:Family of unknown function (DUF6338)
MDETASTLQQVVLLVLFALPGISYQFVRERLHGPVPGEQDLSERVLRAVTASIALDALYLIIAGPQIVHLIKPARQPWFATASADPRQAAAVALALFIAIPAGAAWTVGQVQQRHRPARFKPVPTAWDNIFRGRSACFIRAKLKSGSWVGGWYGESSHAAAYPNPADIYLESAWEMGSDGSFVRRIQNTAGLYLRIDEVEYIEFVQAPSTVQAPPAENAVPASSGR